MIWGSSGGGGGEPKETVEGRPSTSSANACRIFFWKGDSVLFPASFSSPIAVAGEEKRRT